jgi:hypothetical protein
MDFDATLGFPGEGPACLFVRPGCGLVLWLVLLMVVSPSHGVLFPRNAGDMQRILQREARPPLQEGRPVLGVTSKHRSSYLAVFEEWLQVQGRSLESLLEQHHRRVDGINKLLVQFGRCLYAAGRPYNHYAETINALTSRKPALKRQVQEAWNLAFA